MIETSYFDHIVLYVKDLERTRRFYLDVLGMDIAYDEEHFVFLTCGQLQELGITEGTRHGPHQLDPDTELHLLRFTTEASRDVVLAQLKKNDVIVHNRPEDPQGIYFQDPSSHRLQMLPSTPGHATKIKASSFDRVVLYVEDPDDAKRFSIGNFGFKLDQEDENLASVTLRTDKGHRMGLLLRADGEHVSSHNELHHLGFVTNLGFDGKDGDYGILKRALDELGINHTAREDDPTRTAEAQRTRISTRQRAKQGRLPSPHAGVQGLADAVAQKIDGEHRDKDRHA